MDIKSVFKSLPLAIGRLTDRASTPNDDLQLSSCCLRPHVHPPFMYDTYVSRASSSTHASPPTRGL
eukprot:3771238-Amphidinium_carterae.1